VSYNNPEFGTACSSGAFTYLGDSFTYSTAPILTVTAKNASGGTTQNYTGAWFKLTNSSLNGRSYVDATGTFDTSGLPATTNDPNTVDNGNGTASLTFSAGSGLSFQRSTPVAPFNAEISLEINVVDSDGIAYGSNPAKFGDASAGNGIDFSNGKTQRFGRLVVTNAHGSELLDLSVPVQAQYYDGISRRARRVSPQLPSLTPPSARATPGSPSPRREWTTPATSISR
jgi:MSHA biogenesis protein MshQ